MIVAAGTLLAVPNGQKSRRRREGRRGGGRCRFPRKSNGFSMNSSRSSTSTIPPSSSECARAAGLGCRPLEHAGSSGASSSALSFSSSPFRVPRSSRPWAWPSWWSPDSSPSDTSTTSTPACSVTPSTAPLRDPPTARTPCLSGSPRSSSEIAEPEAAGWRSLRGPGGCLPGVGRVRR
jgi:hypothetical protein